MKLISSAKINLRLKCVGKYSNGYHELEMINMRYPIYDFIYIYKEKENKLEYLNSSLDPLKDNLVLKVLEYMQETFNIGDKFKIVIEKHIPIGAGLGGGSSNAAAIINYINNEYKLNLSNFDLISIGKLFGADIPYCLFDNAAIVRGIGEVIEFIDLNLEEDIVIVNPNIYISTKDVFLNNKRISEKSNLEEIKDLRLFENDLEESAFLLNKELQDVKSYLESLDIKHVVMSGSGSSFVLFIDKEKKEEVINKIKLETNYLIYINNE